MIEKFVIGMNNSFRDCSMGRLKIRNDNLKRYMNIGGGWGGLILEVEDNKPHPLSNDQTAPPSNKTNFVT